MEVNKSRTPISQTDISLEAHGWPQQHLIELQGPDGMWYHKWLPSVADLRGHFPPDVLRHNFPGVYDAEEKEEENLYAPLFLDDVLTSADPKMIVEKLLAEDTVVGLYGRYGSFKSFLLVSLLTYLASGRDEWMGLKIYNGPHYIVYAMAEGYGGLKKRLRALIQHEKFTSNEMANIRTNLAVVKTPVYLGNPVAVDQFIEEQKRAANGRKITGVFIDTLFASSTGLDLSSQKDMSTAMGRIKQIKRGLESDIICPVHHQGKDEAKKATGSIVYSTDSNDLYELKVTDAEKRTITLFTDRIKDREPITLSFALEQVSFGDGDQDNSLVLVRDNGIGSPEQKSKEPTRCDQALSVLSLNGMTNTEWKKLFMQTFDVKEGVFNKAVKELVPTGLIRQEGNKYFRRIDPENDPCPKCGETKWVKFKGEGGPNGDYQCAKCHPTWDDAEIFAGANTTISGKGK
jgi:hypothetical protein